MDCITLKGLTFFGYHGCFREEQRNGQPFIIDATLFLDLQSAGASDDLMQTVDYSLVYDEIKVIVQGHPFNLVEGVAERIASVILEKFPKVQAVEITVHKPQAPISGIFADASITVKRQRHA